MIYLVNLSETGGIERLLDFSLVDLALDKGQLF